MNAAHLSSLRGVARAPGKLMILGEYAALEGGWALAMAMDTWLQAGLSTTPEPGVTIEAPQVLAAPWHGSLAELRDGRRPEVLGFAGAALLRGLGPTAEALGGLRLSIQSSFEPRYGLGSSSGVVGAVLVACKRALGQELNEAELRGTGLQIIQEVQGLGSGYDLATQLGGGMVAFRRRAPSDLVGESILLPEEGLPAIRAVWMGRGASTPELVRQARQSHPRGHDIYREMADLAEAGLRALQAGHRAELGRLFHAARDWHRRLGTCPDDLHGLLDALEAIPGVAAAKLTGAGGGDSAALLLHEDADSTRLEQGVRALGLELLNAVPTPRGLLTPPSEATP